MSDHDDPTLSAQARELYRVIAPAAGRARRVHRRGRTGAADRLAAPHGEALGRDLEPAARGR
ncbi:MAG TPA: hypothetical protein H9878_01905 [Candidatus Dietzia merdigallinarum]|nr:hypothetical protein [Candidatus Dietzia merdigallinarum]